jgi:hypothetical protein
MSFRFGNSAKWIYQRWLLKGIQTTISYEKMASHMLFRHSIALWLKLQWGQF